MKFEDFLLFLCFGVMIVLVFAVYFANRRAGKDQIMKYLTRRGATNIQIEHSLFDNDRDTMTFYIHYTGIKGNQHSATCKARAGMFDAGGLFWSELPELNPLPGEAVPAPQAEPTAPKNDRDPLFFSEKIRARSATTFPTYQIVKMLPILGSQDQIVLLDAIPFFENLLRCHADGEIVWQANDTYTDVEWREGELTGVNKANTSVALNLKTGKVVEM